MTTSERMYNHLLSQFRNKPNIKAFLNAVGNELDSIDKVREQIRTQIWPDTAVGKQLDMCGEVADISRRVENAIAMDFLVFLIMATWDSDKLRLDVCMIIILHPAI